MPPTMRSSRAHAAARGHVAVDVFRWLRETVYHRSTVDRAAATVKTDGMLGVPCSCSHT